ncbi:MAG: hypothetical protein ACEQSA_05405 [Weeksellaceae bacterium]
MPKKPLKVGFDLDGVLLYNPARIARPIIAQSKKFLFKKDTTKFHFPKKPWEQWAWKWLHLSSISIADGFEDVKEMIDNKQIEAYIITARYSFLREDFEQWKLKLNTKQYFKECYNNENDEQPHIYKANLVKKLGLDVFVEDNWDIVQHMAKTTKTKVYWISNVLDYKIKYPYKHLSFKKAVDDIKASL